MNFHGGRASATFRRETPREAGLRMKCGPAFWVMSLHEERIAAAVAVLHEVGAGVEFVLPDGTTRFRAFASTPGGPLSTGQYPVEPQAGTTVTLRIPRGTEPAGVLSEGASFQDGRGHRYRVERLVLRPDSVMTQLECTVSLP